MYNAHAFSGGRTGRRFPLAAHFGKKASSGWTFFSQDLTTTVPVIARRRSTHQHSRRRIDSADRFRNQFSTVHATVMNPLFPCYSPPARSDIFTSEMHDRIGTGQH